MLSAFLLFLTLAYMVGGLHTHARGGKLNVHLDYDIHPKLELQRYLNLIIYLTPGWKPEWGGGLGMWGRPQDSYRNGVLQVQSCGIV
jgi:Rps23 Pro-64 3,4-dihydroxylase Tpa1-like proline 4-hydroxylase